MSTPTIEETVAAYFDAVDRGVMTKRQAVTRMWAALGYPDGDIERLLGYYDDASVGG